MPTQAEKGHQFEALHSAPDAFIIANPWDAGSARLLQGLGFKALATSSSGFAFTLGKADGAPTLDEKLTHCRAVADATDIPVSADFEDGFALKPEAVAANVRAVAATGVVGCSIEDFNREAKELIDLSLSVERVAAAVEVARSLDFPFMLTARAEHLLRAGRDLDEVITRLQAYEKAGADVLFSPGIGSLEDLKVVTGAISKPFNMLGVTVPGATLAEFQAAGAQRVSIGGVLPFIGAKPILESCDAMLTKGSFEWVVNSAPSSRIKELLKK